MPKITTLFFILLINSGLFSQTDKNQIYKFTQVMDAVTGNYVDSVNQEKLTESAIKALLKNLDPHSLYFSKNEIEELNRGLKGSFVGVGITYDIIQDTVLILSTVKNGPSDKAGIKPGDRIIKAGNEIIAGTGVDDDKLRDLLTGKKNTKVNVLIKRRGVKNLLSFDIYRDEIPVKSISAAYNINDNITYVKLNRFSATTAKEFKDIADSLIKEKKSKIILDLRHNSGGYLYVAIKLCEFFFPKNKLIVYTEGIHQKKQTYLTQKNGKFKNNKLVILINESSASASEIVSGAVQDLDRGIIIGRRSYGKGLVQKPVYLVDGSMIRLTVAKYYTPSGRNIQKPYDKGVEEYKEDLTRRFEHGEYTDKDSIKFADSLKFKTLINKRTVYGGGGIMPDIFIPADTVHYPFYYRKHFNTGKINEFVHLYVEKNRPHIFKKYGNFKNFKQKYAVTENLLSDFTNYIYDNDIKKNEYLNEFITNDHIKNQIKALIADDLWNDTEYYKIINEKDPNIIKAIEILNNKNKYAEILKTSAQYSAENVKTPEK